MTLPSLFGCIKKVNMFIVSSPVRSERSQPVDSADQLSGMPGTTLMLCGRSSPKIFDSEFYLN